MGYPNWKPLDWCGLLVTSTNTCLVIIRPSTDHSACLSLLQSACPSGKLARWALTIQELDLTIKHCPGKQNANADALSRNLVESSGKARNDSLCESEPHTQCHANMDVTCMFDVCVKMSVAAGVDHICDQKTRSDVLSVDTCDSHVCPSDGSECNVCPIDVCNSVPDAGSCGVRESYEDIRKLQLADPKFVTRIEYLERDTLPADEAIARRIAIESKAFEMIDGVLHHESPSIPGRWCVVVPRKLRPEVLKEAHDGVFAGHFSERKVYDRLRRLYWWPGMRAEVRKFCRGCLSCATRKGLGCLVRPPLQPIPTKGPFHRVGVDFVELPITSSGNKYIIVL